MAAEPTDVAASDHGPRYGAYYYAHDCGTPYERNEHWTSFFRAIATRIVADLAPASVLDAGCALGLLVEQLVVLGVDAHGIDVSEYAIAHAPDAVRDRCRVGSLTEPIEGRFDLVVTIEVLEHMERDDAERALDNLCAVADAVLFSSSPHDYGEPTHVNVQPPEVWAEMFARRGFVRDLDFDASFLTDWAVLYRRSANGLPLVVRAYERALNVRLTESAQVRASLLALQERLERITTDGGITADRDVVALKNERDRLERQVVDLRMQLLGARDLLAAAEATLGTVEAERERLASFAASREQIAHELELMRGSRSWRALSLLLAPLRRYRARR